MAEPKLGEGFGLDATFLANIDWKLVELLMI